MENERMSQSALGAAVARAAHLLVAARSRYTEERLADRIAGGVGQYVILGAGLDSFAYRSPLAPRVRIFEVDHPATQEWKRRQLAYAGFAMAAAASNGEPWLSFFSPSEAATLLEEHGCRVIEQLRQRDWIDRALWDRSDVLEPSELWMLTRAAVT